MSRRKDGDAAAEDLAFRLHSAMLHMMRLVRREDAAFGLSAPRMSALSVVVFGGPRTLAEIAAAEQVSAPTMTRLVAGLERDGYVTREPDPNDARAVRVRATPKAKRVLESGRSRRVRFLARAVAALPPDEQATLGRAADILHRVYDSAAR